MFNTKFDRIIVISLSLVCLFMLGLSILALSDIYNNREADLSAEWNIVRWSFILNVSFISYYAYSFLKRQT